MEKLNVKGHSRILALSLMLTIMTALSGADDKNKKTSNTPPPVQHNAPQVTRQAPPARQAPASRPTPPPQRSTTNTYHPQNTTNTYHPNNPTTVNKGTGNTTNGNPNNKTYSPANNTRTFNKTPASNGPANNPSSNHANDFNKGTPGNIHGNDRAVNNGRPVNTAHYQPVRTTRDFGDKHVAYDRGGHVREIHARNIEVHRSVRGTRTFVAERNGRRIVGLGPHRGYIQRSYYSRSGRVYVQRTYVVGGVRYARVYRSYYWHGAVYYNYAPVVYYRPAFYGWAYSPWPARVVWSWGWGPAPWYGYYGYYFAPYPVYPSASFWLTDYLLAQNLQLAYAAQQNAEAGGPAPDAGDAPPAQQVQLTPEVKQMIADEVQRQLAAERAAAGASNTSSPPAPTEETPTALDPNSRIFVVSTNMDVVKDDGNECTLTAGDVILRTGTAPDGTKVAVNVITSKRDDCPSNTNTAIEVSDLQEMQNQFREQIDSGLKVMADNQGKNGLPAAPDTATSAGEVAAASPDSNAQADLEDQQKNAEQAETDVQKAGGGGGGGTPQN